MVLDIQAKEVIDKIARDLKVQPSLSVPRKLSENIQLEYNVNPERDIQSNTGTLSDGTALTLFTTSLVKDTFLVGATLSVAKDIVSDSIVSQIKFTPFGAAANAAGLAMRYEPITVGSNLNVALNLPMPIKLARGSIVSVANSTATASIDTVAAVYFYEVDAQ